MDKITIDNEKCTQCGICVQKCPSGIIRMKPNNFPLVLEKLNPLCIECGHCEVFCPENALIHNYENVTDIDYNFTQNVIGESQIGEYLRNRRSVRHFKNESVDSIVFQKMLNIIRFAPSASNNQTIQWIIVQNKKKVEELTSMVVDWMKNELNEQSLISKIYYFKTLIAQCEKGNDVINRNAPHLIINYSHKNNFFAATDATIAMTQFDLLMPAFGIGGCWAGFFSMAMKKWEPIQKSLNIPDKHIPLEGMMTGIPKHNAYKIPKRKGSEIQWIE